MKEIPVSSPAGPLVALIDDEDAGLIEQYSWAMAGGKGRYGKYAATRVTLYGHPATHYMHRIVAWAMGLIISPIGTEGGRWTHSVDHINGNKLDNRRENLRLRTRPQQMRNTNDALRSTNRSGHRGVSLVKSRIRYGRPWMAYVTVQYKTLNLGWYETREEAAAARQAWDAAHPA